MLTPFNFKDIVSLLNIGIQCLFCVKWEQIIVTVLVSSHQFKKMQASKTLKMNQKERQKLKWKFIDRIKSNIDIRWNRAKKVLSVIDEIIYKATDRGYSFNGRETLAEKCKVSLSTVDKAIKLVKQSGEVLVAYRHNPASNGYKTPIIILKQHENFTYLNELLGLENSVENKVENTDKPEIPMDEGTKKVSTYVLPTLKQESNKYIKNLQEAKIIQYVTNRINDAMKTGTITFLSSYVDRIVRSLEQTAIFETNKREQAKIKQREAAAREFAIKMNKIKQPVKYNWLEV